MVGSTDALLDADVNVVADTLTLRLSDASDALADIDGDAVAVTVAAVTLKDVDQDGDDEDDDETVSDESHDDVCALMDVDAVTDIDCDELLLVADASIDGETCVKEIFCDIPAVIEQFICSRCTTFFPGAPIMYWVSDRKTLPPPSAHIESTDAKRASLPTPLTIEPTPLSTADLPASVDTTSVDRTSCRMAWFPPSAM